jgi:excisionase family DNA binding protein
MTNSEVDQMTIAMSIADVTRRTGLGRTLIFEAISTGRLRAVKAGSRTIIKADDLRDYVDSLPPARARKTA